MADEPKPTGNDQDTTPNEGGNEKTFTQAELDKIVGERLGRIVMKHTYDDDSLVADCPRIAKAERKDDIEISFTDTAEGLLIKGDLKNYLKVSSQGSELEYDVCVDKDRLLIKTDMSKDKIKIEYCETNYCEAVLFNSEGNPVYGFTCEV